MVIFGRGEDSFHLHGEVEVGETPTPASVSFEMGGCNEAEHVLLLQEVTVEFAKD